MPRTKIARLRRRFQRLHLTPEHRSRDVVDRPQDLAMMPLTAVLQALFFLWLLTFPVGRAENLWAYLPNPPLLHPVTWDDLQVPVYVNDTKILGLPSAAHIWPQWRDGYSYLGVSKFPPICFTVNDSLPHCVRLRHTLESDENQARSGIYWKVKYLYPIFNCSNRGTGPLPQKMKVCSKRVSQSSGGIDWKSCHDNWTVCNAQICERAPLDADCHPTQQVARLWTRNNKTWQTDLWKLTASLGRITVYKVNVTVSPHGILGNGSAWNVSTTACVPEPYALLIGPLNLSRSNDSGVYSLNCTNCALANCVNASTEYPVAILFQPSFVFLPVNLTEPWYEERSLELLDRVRNQLTRGKRFIGLLIAGITALVTMIATAAASAIALSTSIQTAEFVNQLASNVTRTLETQQDWDYRIEQRLNALYDTVQILGDELVSLETRVSLRCHAAFRFMCVTPVPYNASRFAWHKVKNHLNGIWHDTNTSLDIQLLHREIRDLLNAPPLDFDLAKQAQSFFNSLRTAFPSMTQWGQQLIGLVTVAACGILGMGTICCCLRLGAAQVSQLFVSLKYLQLQQEKDRPIL